SFPTRRSSDLEAKRLRREHARGAVPPPTERAKPVRVTRRQEVLADHLLFRVFTGGSGGAALGAVGFSARPRNRKARRIAGLGAPGALPDELSRLDHRCPATQLPASALARARRVRIRCSARTHDSSPGNASRHRTPTPKALALSSAASRTRRASLPARSDARHRRARAGARPSVVTCSRSLTISSLWACAPARDVATGMRSSASLATSREPRLYAAMLTTSPLGRRAKPQCSTHASRASRSRSPRSPPSGLPRRTPSTDEPSARLLRPS